MSGFRKQHPIAKAFDRSAMSVAQIASAGNDAFRGLAVLGSTIPTTIHKDFAMRHSHTSRGLTTSAKTILAFVALGFAGACADSISAPTTEISAKAPAAYTTILGVKTFRYVPSRGLTQRLGEHVLVIPAYGVCDLSSTYGSGHWEDACTPAAHSIVITATTFADANGSPYIEFQPALRFVPSKETDLYLKDGTRLNGDAATITYCSLISCIDESIDDASLVTHRLGKSRMLVRRIKHFSGYNVTAGPCPGHIEPDPEGGEMCVVDGDSPRSGYMLASGLTKTEGTDIIPRRRNREE